MPLDDEEYGDQRRNLEQVPVYKGECCTVEQTKQDLDAVVMDADVSVSPLQVRPSPTGESIQTEVMELREWLTEEVVDRS